MVDPSRVAELFNRFCEDAGELFRDDEHLPAAAYPVALDAACKRIAELEAEIGNLERLNERNVRQADESFVRAQQLEAENKRLRDALAERRWIPAGERLPDINERVLVWCANGHIESTELSDVLVEDGETTVIWCSDRVQAGRATHWMPRPQPTEVSDGE